MINQEIERIKTNENTNQTNPSMINAKATKNMVVKFLKINLKLSEYDRNMIEIQQIYPSGSEDSEIIYLKCKSPQDISIITGNAKFLPRGPNSPDKPTIVTHIPPSLYNRYQAAERFMWKIRKDDEQGQTQTNIRIGAADIQVRAKQKGDNTNWKDIQIIKLPNNFPRAKISLIKAKFEQPDTNEQISESSQMEPTAVRQGAIEDLSGTISGQLQNRSNTKRKSSPQNQQNLKTSKIDQHNTTELNNHWSILGEPIEYSKNPLYNVNQNEVSPKTNYGQ